MTREVFCGSTSLASGSDTAAHFGLGSVSSVDRLTIRWPDGTTQILTGVSADRRLQITEP